MQNNLLNVCDMVGAHLGPYVPAGPLKPINNTSAGKSRQKKTCRLIFSLPLTLFMDVYCQKLCQNDFGRKELITAARAF